MSTIVTILEIFMLICFGAGWPFNIAKAYRSRTAKGTSVFFMIIIEFGYLAGIASKFINMFTVGLAWLGYVATCFYFLNFTMVVICIVLYYRNTKLDKLNDAK